MGAPLLSSPQSLVHHLHWSHRYDFHCLLSGGEISLPQEPCCSHQEDFSLGEKKLLLTLIFYFLVFGFNGVVFKLFFVTVDFFFFFLNKSHAEAQSSPCLTSESSVADCFPRQLKPVPLTSFTVGLCCFSHHGLPSASPPLGPTGGDVEVAALTRSHPQLREASRLPRASSRALALRQPGEETAPSVLLGPYPQTTGGRSRSTLPEEERQRG